jgi:hypothetical protein
MAKKGNLSPFFEWLSCKTEGRKGAACPATPAMGALTPTFAALAPGISKDAGKFFEWCGTADVDRCLDFNDGPLLPMACPGKDEKFKGRLWNLTESWVADYSSPLAAAGAAVATSPASAVLEEMDQLNWRWPACFSCTAEIKACVADAECRPAFAKTLKCLTKMAIEGKSADDELACFVPVNQKRDNVMYCMVDEHECIKPGKSKMTYPDCIDTTLAGDPSFSPAHLHGDWWKVSAWTKGEVYECRACGQVSFSDYHALPWPVKAPADTRDYSIIASSWRDKDGDGKNWTVNETSLFGPRPSHKGYPAKQQHVGVMFGLSYLENFTVVHDGSAEDEPFFLFYGCGSTKQGAYVTGFALAKKPEASPKLKAKIAQLSMAHGINGPWCDVDNSCASSRQDGFGMTFIV